MVKDRQPGLILDLDLYGFNTVSATPSPPLTPRVGSPTRRLIAAQRAARALWKLYPLKIYIYMMSMTLGSATIQKDPPPPLHAASNLRAQRVALCQGCLQSPRSWCYGVLSQRNRRCEPLPLDTQKKKSNLAPPRFVHTWLTSFQSLSVHTLTAAREPWCSASSWGGPERPTDCDSD